jgi:ABC-type multidrug transport system fused ATPase/permease subunit
MNSTTSPGAGASYPSQPPQREDRDGLRRLGAGSHEDRLGFRLVLRILLRCLPWLRAVRGHLLALVGAFTGIALLLLPVVIVLFDVTWTRVLKGEALTALEAAALGFDPATTVGVDALSAELRRAIAVRVVWIGAALAAVTTPLVIGLFYYQVWILQRINQLLRLAIYERLQALSLRFHAESRVGDAIYRLYQDSATVTQLIEILFLTPLFALARFAFSLVVVALFDPWLAVILLLGWLPALLLGRALSRRLRVGFRAAREANSALTSRIQETLAGIRVLKAYGAEAREQARFEADSRAAFAAAFDARQRFALFGVAAFWIAGGMLLAGTAWATLETRAEAELFAKRLLLLLGFTGWNLGLYNLFKLRLGDGATATRQLLRTWGKIQDVAIGLDRVFELLDVEPEVQDAPGAIDAPDLRHGVVFRGVSFAYGRSERTLDGVELEARTGTITAIVGPTGSGKSTLVSLLLRLFDPDEGRIELDGVDLRRIRLASLRASVAIALQENLLFGTTVRENIRYAVPGASDEAVRAAARVAGADAFVERLPEGYDTLLGERGTKLSTGQRQRLSIARAVLKDAPILVLDEPTASLDAETELAVMRNLATWGAGRAIFLITHRLSTIRRADRIVVLEAGRIVEQGSHAELLAREGGVYRRLVEAEEGPWRGPA